MTRDEIHELKRLSFLYHPERIRQLLAQADLVCANTFVFTRRWDMEATHQPVTFQGPICWRYLETGDVEWPVMLARQSYLLDVVLAYLLTEDRKYLDCFVRVVQEFIENCPRSEEENHNSWRTLDTGIRAAVWVRCLELLQPLDLLSPGFLSLVRGSLKEHFDFLFQCMDAYHLLSNWGVLANHGAVFAGTWLVGQGSAEVADRLPILWERLGRQIHIQVLADGVHWEQSPMYHHEVLWCYLELIHLAKQKGLALDEELLARTHAMCLATLGEAKPNHHQPMRGDSDNTDVRDILTFAAFLFQDAQLRSGSYDQPDLENLWRMGAAGVRAYLALPCAQAANRGQAFAHSGNYYFRCGQGEKAAWVRFRCGPLGSGHGHADLLHLDLSADGADILVDPGRYTYVNGPMRTGLKASSAHNTLRIDQEDFTDCCASWRFGRIAKPIKGEYFENDRYGYVSGMHLGYAHKGLFVRREVVYCKPGILVLFDSIFGVGEHQLEQNFHFGPGKVSLTANGAAFENGAVRARVQSFAVQPALSLHKTPYSPTYNLLQQTDCLRVQSLFPQNQGLLTVIGFGESADFVAEKMPITQALDHSLLTDEDAQAVSISCPAGQRAVLFSRKEIIGKVNLLCAADSCGYGQAIVFEPDAQPFVLSW